MDVRTIAAKTWHVLTTPFPVLFHKETGLERISRLTGNRAQLEARRDTILDDISRMEQWDKDLVAQGQRDRNPTVRKSLANRLAELRRDIGRQRVIAKTVQLQIKTISTDIHNLTLLEQGKIIIVPNIEEMTETSVAAEQMLEELQATSDMAVGLEAGQDQAYGSPSEEEAAILAEFESSDQNSAIRQELSELKNPPSREKMISEAAAFGPKSWPSSEDSAIGSPVDKPVPPTVGRRIRSSEDA